MSSVSAADALIAAALIGMPLALLGVLGLGWLDDWRHRRQRVRADRAARADAATPASAPEAPRQTITSVDAPAAPVNRCSGPARLTLGRAGPRGSGRCAT